MGGAPREGGREVPGLGLPDAPFPDPVMRRDTPERRLAAGVDSTASGPDGPGAAPVVGVLDGVRPAKTRNFSGRKGLGASPGVIGRGRMRQAHASVRRGFRREGSPQAGRDTDAFRRERAGAVGPIQNRRAMRAEDRRRPDRRRIAGASPAHRRHIAALRPSARMSWGLAAWAREDP